MHNLTVYMDTITPVWTGNAFNKGKLLKPQSIIGSLRFWLEVFCYAAGELCKNCDKEELDQEKFMQKINELLEREKELSIVKAKRKALRELGISIPSQAFGCNGWEGFIKIKRISSIDEKEIKLPEVIYKERGNYNVDWNEADSRRIDRKKEHAWYFPQSFIFGRLTIEIELVDENIGKEILYPLLNFIQKYGFVGGKNNIGYGRVKFRLDNVKLSDFYEFKLNNKTKMIDDVVEENLKEFNELIKYDLIKNRKIGLYKLEDDTSEDKDILEIIKELIREKSKWRTECKNKSILEDNKRHYFFGSTCRDKYKDIEGPNATKIIPWINQVAENKYEYGFISLILLQDFPKEVK